MREVDALVRGQRADTHRRMRSALATALLTMIPVIGNALGGYVAKRGPSVLEVHRQGALRSRVARVDRVERVVKGDTRLALLIYVAFCWCSRLFAS